LGASQVHDFLSSPITALVLSLVLFVLGTQAGRTIAKVGLFFGSVAGLAWLLSHNAAFRDVSVAALQTITTIAIVLIGAAVVVALGLIALVFLMYVVSERPARAPGGTWQARGRSGTRRPAPLAEAGDLDLDALLEHEQEYFAQLANEVVEIVGSLGGRIDDERPIKMVADLGRAYFSGLSTHMADVKDVQRRCDEELTRLAAALPAGLPDADVRTLRKMAHARSFLPDRDAWHALADELDIEFPLSYPALRLVCLHRNWRQVGTILFKCYYAAEVLPGRPAAY
jgi:hypothetical protein